MLKPLALASACLALAACQDLLVSEERCQLVKLTAVHPDGTHHEILRGDGASRTTSA